MGLQNERARVVLHLPANQSGEVQAYSEIINYLNNQKQTPNSNVTGFTSSNTFPTPFHGYWWDDKNKQWEDDQIAFVFIDYDFPLSDPNQVQNLEKELSNLKTVCLDKYKAAQCPQKSLWMVVYRVQLFD